MSTAPSSALDYQRTAASGAATTAGEAAALASQRPAPKASQIEALFKACDANADGLLDVEELAEALLAAASTINMHLTEDQARHAACSMALRAGGLSGPTMSRCSSLMSSAPEGMAGSATHLSAPRPMTREAFHHLLAWHMNESQPTSCTPTAKDGETTAGCRDGSITLQIPPTLAEAPPPPPTARQNQPPKAPCCSGAQTACLTRSRCISDAWWFVCSTRGAFTILLCAALASMWAWGFVVHLHGFEFELLGYAWPVARACAYVIRLTMALMLFFVCARSLTFLRATPLRHVIPVDNAISLHMLLGYVFFAAALGHSLCHFVGHTVMATSPGKYEAAGLPAPTLTEVWANWPSISGLLMLTILITFYAWAVPSIRRSPLLRGTPVGRVLQNYNTFHRTHQLLWVSLVLLALLHPLPDKPGVPHTSRLWLFIAVPFIMLLVERAYRAWVRGQRVEVVSIKALPGILPGTTAGPASSAALAAGAAPHAYSTGVTELVLRVSDAPYTFRHKAGQYLHLQCEEVSQKQWHPFTITSAPDDELLTIHAAVQGDWTEKLYALASAVDASAATTAAAATPSPAAAGAQLQLTARVAPRPPSCAPSSGDLHAQHHGDAAAAALAHAHADGASSSSNVLLTQSPGSSGVLSSHALQLVRQALEEERRSSTSAGSRSSNDGAHTNGKLKAAAPAPSCLSPRAALSMRGGVVPCPGLVKPHFCIDGPYGAPTQHFMEHEVLVLVAGGIGVTPMVAILRHIMHQLAARLCGKCNTVHLDADFWLRRLYLHFIFRQQGMLQWFLPTFEGITRLAPPSLCHMHFHYTGAAAGAADNQLIQLAQRVEEHQEVCLLANAHIRAKTSFGRPDLKQIVAQVAATHPTARVGVLFCGAPQMGDQLEQAVRESGHPHMKVIREVFGN